MESYYDSIGQYYSIQMELLLFYYSSESCYVEVITIVDNQVLCLYIGSFFRY